jgi:hypothetical protein
MHCLTVMSIPVYLYFTVTGVAARVHSSSLLFNLQSQGTVFSFVSEADISRRWFLKRVFASHRCIH